MSADETSGHASSGSLAGSPILGVLEVSAVSDAAPELATYVVIEAAAYAVCLLVTKRLFPGHRDPWNLADVFFSITIFPLLSISAIWSCCVLHDGLEARWRGVTPASRFCLMLYTSRTLIHMPIQCMVNMSSTHLVMMTFHHLFSFLCIGMGLVTNRMVFWGCLDICCEVSTIFLNNVYMLKELTINGKELKELAPAWVYAANGVLLWLSFIFFRLALFPAWLYFWYRDITAAPSETWDKSNAVERYLYPSVTVLLLVLSSAWFVPLTQGMLKAVQAVGVSRPPSSKVE
uniref:TLC domain-containing protein n=1 Tax=Zooxanthella nutricula TaxID=1333877 RepID=A0A6U6NSY2_9DINO|mmetsp:Transcript_52090/g.158190  ORF Transcript_52090/g.158190 Transcript_52090/m.158190 type:complete len:289 (+) Transcript_52090:57-923(+)